MLNILAYPGYAIFTTQITAPSVVLLEARLL